MMKLLLFNWIFRLLFFAKFCGIFWTQKFNHQKYYPLNLTIKVIVKIRLQKTLFWNLTKKMFALVEYYFKDLLNIQIFLMLNFYCDYR